MTTSLKNIDKAIARFATSAAAVNTMAHEVAMMIVMHAAPVSVGGTGSGDCTRAVKLVRAMPASFRRTNMIDWFTKNTPIRVKLSDGGDRCEYDPAYKKLSDEEKALRWNIENANVEPWYEISENTPEEKPFDFAAMLKFVEGLSKRVEKNIDQGKVPEQDLSTAKALVEKLAKVRVTRVSANDQQQDAAAA
jgi:hypothetical protein